MSVPSGGDAAGVPKKIVVNGEYVWNALPSNNVDVTRKQYPRILTIKKSEVLTQPLNNGMKVVTLPNNCKRFVLSSPQQNKKNVNLQPVAFSILKNIMGDADAILVTKAILSVADPLLRSNCIAVLTKPRRATVDSSSQTEKSHEDAAVQAQLNNITISSLTREVLLRQRKTSLKKKRVFKIPRPIQTSNTPTTENEQLVSSLIDTKFNKPVVKEYSRPAVNSNQEQVNIKTTALSPDTNSPSITTTSTTTLGRPLSLLKLEQNKSSQVKMNGNMSSTHMELNINKIKEHCQQLRQEYEVLRQGLGKVVSMDGGSYDGLSPIHVAAIENDVSMIERIWFVLKHSQQNNEENINVKTPFGETPLHLCIREDSPDTLHWLLKNKANPLITDNYGENALHMAMAHKDVIYAKTIIEHICLHPIELLYHWEKVELALSKTSLVSEKTALRQLLTYIFLAEDDQDLNPIMIAAKNGHLDHLRCAIDACCSAEAKPLQKNEQSPRVLAIINATGVNGKTALYMAVESGVMDDVGDLRKDYADVVEYLLAQGADPLVKTTSNHTAVDVVSKTSSSVLPSGLGTIAQMIKLEYDSDDAVDHVEKAEAEPSTSRMVRNFPGMGRKDNLKAAVIASSGDKIYVLPPRMQSNGRKRRHRSHKGGESSSALDSDSSEPSS